MLEMDMTLGEKQQLFCSLLAMLIYHAESIGYKCAFGEATRSDEQAEINALGFEGRERLCEVLKANEFEVLAEKIANNGKAGGIRKSLHGLRLAVDLLLFRDGKYLTETEDYRPVGEFWESLGGTWGGRFKDGNHFSLEHEGVK